MGASGEETPGINDEEVPGALGKESSGWTTRRIFSAAPVPSPSMRRGVPITLCVGELVLIFVKPLAVLRSTMLFVRPSVLLVLMLDVFHRRLHPSFSSFPPFLLTILRSFQDLCYPTLEHMLTST